MNISRLYKSTPVLLFVLAFAVANISAQIATGGIYPLEQSVIANGGGASSGGFYAVEGTNGQPAAGTNGTGGAYCATRRILESIAWTDGSECFDRRPGSASRRARNPKRPRDDHRRIADLTPNGIDDQSRFLCFRGHRGWTNVYYQRDQQAIRLFRAEPVDHGDGQYFRSYFCCFVAELIGLFRFYL